MIRAVFSQSLGSFQSVEVSGHAGFAAWGSDIVCASVSSAVQLCANGVTEVLGYPAEVTVEDNRIAVALQEGGRDRLGAEAFLEALYVHLRLLSEDYQDTIEVTVLEV